jgi:hypothetical protein
VAIQKCSLNQCTGLPRCARNDGHIELISVSLNFSGGEPFAQAHPSIKRTAMNARTPDSLLNDSAAPANRLTQDTLIAVWPDETWCAYQDIAKSGRGLNAYSLYRVTRWRNGEPIGYEPVACSATS